MEIAEICEVFGLGSPTGPLAYVARGELGRVSRLTTGSGVWAVKEIELFAPTADEADANVELQESMLDAGVNLPRPRRTVDGHALVENVRVYEWLDMTPLPVANPDAEELVAEALACIHLHASPTSRNPDPWYCDVPPRRRLGCRRRTGSRHLVGAGRRRAGRRAGHGGPTRALAGADLPPRRVPGERVLVATVS